MELAPFSSRGPVKARLDGCRGFVGPFPSTPLDAYGYVVLQDTDSTDGSGILSVEVESPPMPAMLDDPLRRSHAEPSQATAAALHALTGRRARRSADR